MAGGAPCGRAYEQKRGTGTTMRKELSAQAFILPGMLSPSGNLRNDKVRCRFWKDDTGGHTEEQERTDYCPQGLWPQAHLPLEKPTEEERLAATPPEASTCNESNCLGFCDLCHSMVIFKSCSQDS